MKLTLTHPSITRHPATRYHRYTVRVWKFQADMERRLPTQADRTYKAQHDWYMDMMLKSLLALFIMFIPAAVLAAEGHGLWALVLVGVPALSMAWCITTDLMLERRLPAKVLRELDERAARRTW